MDPLALLIIGGTLLFIGALVMAANVTNLRRRKRILATPTSKIALAPAGGLVVIAGTILTNRSERTLVRRLLVPFVAGARFAGAGVLALAAGLLAS